MAFLVPLLLPGVINGAANIALGVTNAVQGTSSNVSLKIGDRVFTTNKPFPWTRLPEEVRREIVVMALEASRDLIIPSSDFVPLRRPFQPPSLRPLDQEVLHNPLNPDNPHYRSVLGESVHANGYPISSWKWQGLGREWREELRRRLWRRCVVGGRRAWSNLRKMMDREDFDLFTMVRELELHQGFETPMELYLILRHHQLTHLSSLSIMPRYPFSPHPFEPLLHPFDFGLQLVPAPPADGPGLRHLELGLPLDMCTNRAQRQHLRALRLESLAITVIRPDEALFRELADLLAEPLVDPMAEPEPQEESEAHTPPHRLRKVTVRYVYYLSPTARELCDPALLVSPTLDRFEAVHIRLPWVASAAVQHPYIGRGQSTMAFADRLVQLVTDAPDESRLRRYTVSVQPHDERFGLAHDGKETVLYEPPAAIRERVAEEATAAGSGSPASGGEKGGKGKEVAASSAPTKKDEHWERETNLKLLGGLISLRLESKKH